MQFKIAPLNLCLGLTNKKEQVKLLVEEICIDIQCLQEIELQLGYDSQLLGFKNYSLEIESYTIKSRVGTYINSK